MLKGSEERGKGASPWNARGCMEWRAQARRRSQILQSDLGASQACEKVQVFVVRVRRNTE